MNRILKRILVTVLILSGLVAAVWGGLILYRNLQRDPVRVYEVQNFAMTEYWGDMATTQGNVTLEDMQQVYLTGSSTVRDILVFEGQEVKKGDALLTLDTTLTALDVEKAEIAVKKQRLALESMEKQLEKLYAMRPSSGQPTIIDPVYDHVDASQLPQRLTPLDPSLGSRENPVVLLWDVSRPVALGDLTQKLSDLSLLRAPAASLEPQPTDTPQDDPEAEDTLPAATYPADLHVVVLIRVGSSGNARNGNTLAQYGFTCNLESEGKLRDLSLTMDLPLPESVPPVAQPTIIPDKGSGYSQAELNKMRSDQEILIRDAKLALQLAELDLEKKKLETGDGIIRAQMDGTIKAVRDPMTAQAEGMPLVLLSAGGGYYIEGALGEWDLSTMSPGAQVSVTSWRTGTQVMGTVKEVSDMPADSSYYGGGQPNVSYYPFRVFVDDSASLQEGEYVEMSYQPETEVGDFFYLEKVFVRREGGRSYCMVKDENGKLTRRWVETGAELWGSYIQIRSGLELIDRLAFPYGTDVTEGASTRDAEPQEFYESAY